VRVTRRVQVLLKSDEGLSDQEIAEHVDLSARAVADIRRFHRLEFLNSAVIGEIPAFRLVESARKIVGIFREWSVPGGRTA
jgi:hypothetical protein